MATPTQDLSAAKTTRPKNAPRALFEAAIVKRAVKDAFFKLDPRVVAKNPVMFVVQIGSAVTTFFWIRGLLGGATDSLHSLQ